MSSWLVPSFASMFCHQKEQTPVGCLLIGEANSTLAFLPVQIYTAAPLPRRFASSGNRFDASHSKWHELSLDAEVQLAQAVAAIEMSKLMLRRKTRIVVPYSNLGDY